MGRFMLVKLLFTELLTLNCGQKPSVPPTTAAYIILILTIHELSQSFGILLSILAERSVTSNLACDIVE